MTVRFKVRGAALPFALLALTSCTKGIFESPVYLSVITAPRPNAIPAGATMVFTATVSNQLSLPQWTLLNTASAPNVGTLTPVSGAPNSISYTAPPAPPIYTGVTPAGFTQGAVTLDATVNPPVNSTLAVAHDAVTFFITSSTISVSLSPASANVALNATLQFNGYEVGSANNALAWQVNGVTGGSLSTGTISATGLYTAPSALPMTGNTLTITAQSSADPTKSASSTVTLH